MYLKIFSLRKLIIQWAMVSSLFLQICLSSKVFLQKILDKYFPVFKIIKKKTCKFWQHLGKNMFFCFCFIFSLRIFLTKIDVSAGKKVILIFRYVRPILQHFWRPSTIFFGYLDVQSIKLSEVKRSFSHFWRGNIEGESVRPKIGYQASGLQKW
jgi:hypothetical protein